MTAAFWLERSLDHTRYTELSGLSLTLAIATVCTTPATIEVVLSVDFKSTAAANDIVSNYLAVEYNSVFQALAQVLAILPLGRFYQSAECC